MPSLWHELMVDMFSQRPAMAAELLESQMGFTLPKFDRVETVSANLTNITPAEYRADVAIKMIDGRNLASAVVVEVQQRPDKLPNPARAILRSLMSIGTQHRPFSDWGRRHYRNGERKGKVAGETQALLTFLNARGLAVTDDVRDRITGCTDLEQLNTWIRRAATAETIDELFA